MDFDSPDVEKDFPGLYASTEIGHKDTDGKNYPIEYQTDVSPLYSLILSLCNR